jgi:hypothetical protein
MSVLVRYQPTSLSREVYDRVNDVLRQSDLEGPPPELALHVLFGDGSALRVSEIWESEEAWRRFYDTALRSAFAEAQLEVPPPEVLEVHEMWGSALAQRA